MKISIVTPSYNQGQFIEAAIQSVLIQRYPDFEHIVVDNCSTDQTADILSQYAHLQVISEPDRGQSDALNKGFQRATGEIVGWLNADDLYLAGCFDQVGRYFAEHPDVDIVYGDFRWIYEDNRVRQIRRELGFDRFMLNYLHFCYIPTPSAFFRRKIFDDANWIDLSFQYAMDYEWLLRLAAKGYRFAHIPEIWADFRWHAEGKSTKASVVHRQEHERAIRLHNPWLGSLPPALQSPTRKSLELLARSKRYWLKGWQGFYLQQWPR